MNKIRKAIQKFLYPDAPTEYDPSLNHEFCPKCEANLTLQKGYDNALPYWVCKGCGEMLINPSLDTDSDIVPIAAVRTGSMPARYMIRRMN